MSLTAAAPLLPLVEYSDLDSALPLKPDPYVGFVAVNGQRDLPAGTGLAVRERSTVAT